MVKYKKIKLDDDKDLYFVGDIHGDYKLFKHGVHELGIEDQYIISVGDLIDRGKENVKCVEEFTTKDNRLSVIGNHEQLMIEGLTSRNHYECWMENGGNTTMDEVGEAGLSILCNMLSNTPILLEVEHRGITYGVVHGGIPLCFDKNNNLIPVSWKDVVSLVNKNISYANNFIWDRNALKQCKDNLKGLTNKSPPEVKGVDFVIHGHSFVKKPIQHKNRVYIDTGGVFNGKLTFITHNGKNIESYTTNQWGFN